MFEELINLAINEAHLDDDSHHGISHWERVRDIGRYLAQHTGADKDIVDLFAYFHDLKRENDGVDPKHGLRAAEFVESLYSQGWNDLSKKQLNQLVYACGFHCQSGAKSDDITVQTCWDADRLDLWRIGVKPDPFFLNTDIAKDPKTIEWSKRLYENWENLS